MRFIVRNDGRLGVLVLTHRASLFSGLVHRVRLVERMACGGLFFTGNVDEWLIGECEEIARPA